MKKLVIPTHLKQWVKPEIANLDGKVFPAWTQEFTQTGWLVDVPEPVVPSAEESAKKNKIYRDEIGYDLYIDGFKTGDESGQLREWQRKEQVELRESVEQLKIFYCGGADSLMMRTYKALNNLKPPYEK